MKIYNSSGIEIIDIQVDDSSVRYRSIMSDDSLTLKFSHTATVSIPVGSYVIFEGQRYTLWLPENFKKHNTRNFEYTVVMGGYREALKLFKYKDMSSVPYRLKFSLTAKPVEFLQLLVDNMNIHDTGWTAGDCIDASERTISFNHEYCSDVLSRIAQEFSTEYEFESKKIHLRKVEKFKDAPLALSYGKGNGFKSGVARANDGDKQPIGRLYVQGGERNIDYSKYGSTSLLLPKSATLVVDGKTYRTDAHGMYITRDGNNLLAEDSYDAQSIYPSRTGTISEVIAVDVDKHFYDIKDASIPASLDYSACRIDGEKATISFQSGALAGREFDIEQTDKALTGYVHAERRFRIVPQELDGVVMPGGAFVPAVGDKYAIFNISLPNSYIDSASMEMFQECVKYFAENEKQKFSFTGELDGIWAKSQWLAIGGKIVPGGHVLFSDDQFLPNGEVVRIVSVKDYVNFPHKPEITLSNAPVSGGFNSILGKLEAEEVVIEGNKKEVIQYSKRQWRDARETMAMLEDSLLQYSSGINPITVNTMQLLVGDESLQFRFVNSKTTPVQTSHNVTFNTSDKKLTASSGIIQHMTLGINKVSPQHAPSEYKYWDMAAYVSPPLPADKAYYLYAKCSKTTQAGTFVLSETPIELEGVANYYHLLMGLINSEFDNERSIGLLYGFTEITPGRITAPMLASPNGNMIIDMINGIITGQLRFQKAGAVVDMEQYVDDTATDIGNAENNAIAGSADYTDSVATGLQTAIDGAQQAANDADAKARRADYLIEILKEFDDVTIGLILTKLIAAMDGNNVVRSYMSGNPQLNPTAFAAGVDNFGGANETKNVDIRHDGSGNLGDLFLSKAGMLYTQDPVTGEVKFKLNAGELPSLDVLLSNTLASGTATNSPVTLQYVPANEERSQILPDTITVTQQGSEARLQCELTASCSNATEGAGNFSLYLLRNGVRYMDIATLQVSELYTSETNPVDLTLNNLPKGTYELEVVLTHYGRLTNLKGTISGSTLSWEFKVEGVQRVEIGLDGFMQFYTDAHWYFTKTGFFLRGFTDMPGVLLSTTVTTAGTFINSWGAKIHNTQMAVKVSTGTYDVYHSIGHAKYTINANAYGNRTISIVSKGTDRCRVAIYSGSSLVDSQFDITLSGNNYA